MLKILQARLQQYMNHELPDVQAGCRKGRGSRDTNRFKGLDLIDMDRQTVSLLGNEYIKAVYCYPAYLTYMQNTPCKMSGKHKLKSVVQFVYYRFRKLVHF